MSRGSSKLARGFAGRRFAHELLEAWGVGLRDPARPVVWFHAPSVGEGLQAAAVMESLRARRPEVQLVYTYFSPSAEEMARGLDVDVATYLPWDLRSVVDRVLDAVEPDAIVFTKTEVWPVLVESAVARGVATALVAASVPDGAGRLRAPARRLLRPTWESLVMACANSEADARRLEELGVGPDLVDVTGDPGVDSAATRFERLDPDAPWLTPFRDAPAPTLLAGSTWPADDTELLPAIRHARAAHPGMRLVLVPHEPTAPYVDALLSRLAADGWSPTTLSAVESAGSIGGHDAVVVDRVGVLATLYSVADVSYVGGGFHERGLHSVLEPAVAACPLVFGPLHENARAAADLVAADGAKIARNSDELGRIVADLLGARADRERIGENARGYVNLHRGAAGRCADRVSALITSRAEPSEPEES